jgi:CTP synthase
VSEAIRAAGFGNTVKIKLRWVPSDDCVTPAGAAAALKGADGIVIPGGFGVRGIEGKVNTSRYARENRIPILGLCLGLQCMTIDAARNLAGLAGANSVEFDEKASYPVISTMADQEDIVAGKGDLGGTMRLGAYPAKLKAGSIVAEVYGSTEISERHRHRYEVNNDFRDKLSQSGLVFSGTSPDGRLVEFIELDRETHPYFVATQAHPELKSRPTRPHPLFDGLVKAAIAYASADELPVEIDVAVDVTEAS